MRHVVEGDPQLGLALRELIEQPRVLHGDHRLRGEALQERDLLRGERSHFLSVEGDRPKQGTVFAQRDGDQGSRVAEFDEGAQRRMTHRSPQGR